MNRLTQRPYRKNVNSKGWLYVGGEAREITIKNISINGVLAQLHNKTEDEDSKYLHQNLAVSKSIDFYMPQLRLSGEAKVVWMESGENDGYLLGMAFNNVAYDVDSPVFVRKSHRKEVAIPGRILLNGEYHAFVTVDMSLGGIKICLPEKITVDKDVVAEFEFEALKMRGVVKVAWTSGSEGDSTLIGLAYIKPRKSDNTVH